MAKDTKHLTAEHIKPALHDLLEDEQVLQWLRKFLGKILDIAQNTQKNPQENPEYERFKIQSGEYTSQLEALKCEVKNLKIERDVAQSLSVSLQGEFTQLKKKLQHIEQALLEAKAEAGGLRQRSNLPTPYTEVVQHARNDGELIRRFRLPNQANDVEWLVQLVAGFSSESGIKRLWEMLKLRCEAQSSPLSAMDRELLESALRWYNINWPDKPCILSDPIPGEIYQFEQHLRPAGMSGETIQSTWLPGISGLKLKPFVSVR
jgi:hypothetical protein